MILSQSAVLGLEARQGLLWPWLAVFAFLLPISLNINGVGVSANYSYLALLFFLTPPQTWPKLFFLVIFYLAFSYLSGLLFVADAVPGFHFRQFVSFLLFLSALLISVVRLPFSFLTFARVTAATAGVYSVWVVIALIATGTPISNAGMVKSILAGWVPDWPQRYIIVVMLGFFLALLLARKSSRWLFVAGLCGFCIIVSHGRASYFAMLGAVTLLALLYLRGRDWNGLKRLVYALLLSIVMVAGFAGKGMGDLLLSQEKGARSAISLLLERSAASLGLPVVEEPPKDTQATIDHLYSEGGEASGNIRLMIWSILLNRMVDDRMWFGSGFAGPYLFDAAIGSAHSQYIDVLYRTGPLGLILYLGLWAVLVRRCFEHSVELGVAMLAWFIYGFFHETTKYSYGAFLFFSLLSYAWHGWKREEHCAAGARVSS